MNCVASLSAVYLGRQHTFRTGEFPFSKLLKLRATFIKLHWANSGTCLFLFFFFREELLTVCRRKHNTVNVHCAGEMLHFGLCNFFTHTDASIVQLSSGWKLAKKKQLLLIIYWHKMRRNTLLCCYGFCFLSLCPLLVSKGKFLPSSRFALFSKWCSLWECLLCAVTHHRILCMESVKASKKKKTRNWFPVLFKGLCSSFLDNTTTYALWKTRSQQDSLLTWAADSAVKCGKTTTGLWRVCFQKQGFPRSAWQLWLKHVYSSCINCQMIFKAI